ncbi:hypothetical protein F5Y16DRAFT_418662 [Xylariaceae sp. FL0255]|nr:hypothetical protein F5Y16DRAFT_418662 [Xylariaceae sp. FL0255]
MLAAGFYSPGLVCPSGHTTACASTSGGSYNYQFNFALTSGGTAARCYPSNYVCGASDTTQLCVYTATSTSDYAYCCWSTTSSIAPLDIPTYYVTQDGGAMDSPFTVSIGDPVLFAPIHRLNWQHSDLSSSGTGSTTTSQQASNTATPFTSTITLERSFDWS